MLEWDLECKFKPKYEAKQHAAAGFALASLSLVLKLNSGTWLDLECILKHNVEAKQHATVGFRMPQHATVGSRRRN